MNIEEKNIIISTHGNMMILIMNENDQQYGYDFGKGTSKLLSFYENK